MKTITSFNNGLIFSIQDEYFSITEKMKSFNNLELFYYNDILHIYIKKKSFFITLLLSLLELTPITGHLGSELYCLIIKTKNVEFSVEILNPNDNFLQEALAKIKQKTAQIPRNN